MNKITKIIEAKNIEFYKNGCIKSIDNTDNFLLKFNADDAPDLKFILDKDYSNNFSYSVYKDYIASSEYTTDIIIEGNSSQSFAIIGIE
jgi:hypothetical protein